MIEEKHLKAFNTWSNEAEYTRGCGWIDWTHASPGRSDLGSIWSLLPHKEFASADQGWREAAEQRPLDVKPVVLQAPRLAGRPRILRGRILVFL